MSHLSSDDVIDGYRQPFEETLFKVKSWLLQLPYLPQIRSDYQELCEGIHIWLKEYFNLPQIQLNHPRGFQNHILTSYQKLVRLESLYVGSQAKSHKQYLC